MTRRVGTTDRALRRQLCQWLISRSNIKYVCARALRVMIASPAGGTPSEVRMSVKCMRRARLRVARWRDGACQTHSSLRWRLWYLSWLGGDNCPRGAQVVTSEHRVVPRLVGGLVRVAQRWVKKNRCDFLLGLVAVLIADHAT